MNIFLTDPDPRLCAQALDDVRVNKMAIEAAQLLSTALRLNGVTDAASDSASLGIYRATHTAHPCSHWARTSRARFLWLVEHGLELCAEHELRRRNAERVSARRPHASQAVILRCADLAHHIPDGPLVFDFNSSGFRTGDVFFDYRLCMVSKWRDLDGNGGPLGKSLKSRKPVWSYRDPPAWKREMWHLDLSQFPQK